MSSHITAFLIKTNKADIYLGIQKLPLVIAKTYLDEIEYTIFQLI